MKYTISALIMLMMSCLTVFAQTPSPTTNYTAKGIVADTVSNVKLENASVSILLAKDSILVSYTRAASDGKFNFPKLAPGSYILLVAYPDYADYVEQFKLDGAKTDYNFGTVKLSLKSRLLQEVMIKGSAAQIKIKGDTTEYDAKTYKIQPNAKVEDLLKQFQGIQVDKDGKITAQGETVSKVLVDGEEFFGDDPTLVTKNLRADMVDKVQLYDKKSDQATFTGIDDGQKTKTLNIKLKEDKKKGSFGKASAAVGTRDFYQGELMFNTFKNKQKFSVYGTLSNTGKTGLGWNDNDKYGGGSDNVTYGDDGSVSIFFSSGGDELDSFDGRYSGQGLPTARTGGAHFDTKWNEDKESVNGNYKIGSIEVEGTNNSININNLSPTLSQTTLSDQKFDNYLFRQKLDGTYNLKIDTTSNLKLTFGGTLKESDTRQNFNSVSRRNDTLQNDNVRELTTDGNQKLFNASIFYNKKLKKKGRTFSVNIAPSVTRNNADGFLKSTINYYDRSGALDSTTNIDQYKVNDLQSVLLNSNITYTEPFTKDFSVVLNYGVNINNATADRRTFERTVANGIYNRQIDSLSSDFKLNQLSNQAGAVFNYKKGKTTLNFGTRAAIVNFQQVNRINNMRFDRNFTNWFPQASWQYRFSQQKSFRLSYNGNTTQPTIDQVQPIRINNDPLNITLGNPDLDPSFTHRLNFNANSYKVLADEWMNLYGSYSFTTNPIVTNVFTDTITGRSVIQSFNLPNRQTNNFYGGLWYNRKIFWGFNAGLNGNINGNTFYNMVNNQENRTKAYSYSLGLSLSKYATKKYDIRVDFRPSYNTNETSLNPERNSNGRAYNLSGGFNVYLPFKIQIGSDIEHEYQAATQTFADPFRRTIWNASVTKTFMKQDNLRLSLAVNDLLNQNTGFSRSANNNIIYQNTYTTIRRYFMFSISYDFNHMGGGVAKN
ncbi:outer membrane beta-barrel family protein [Mucilaginibacter defluvii]|uniref:TonB-dependent receptor n=1 Tax=Mucilaginibacter defluvii TaxID=1196019 RepID=A0ABP9FH87_9SPHI